VATLKNYMRTLWDMQQTVCNALGMDLRRASFENRCMVIAIDAPIALLIKILTDKGLVTDAELNGYVQAARNQPFTRMPVDTPMLSADGSNTLPFPDPIQE